MRVILEVLAGPDAGKRVVLPHGGEVRVGRTAEAQIVLPQDTMLSSLHFALESDGQTCRLRDLKSRFGTRLNGRAVADAPVQDGDQIQAGQTRFQVRFEGEPAGIASPTTPPTGNESAETASAPVDGIRGQTRLLQILRAAAQPLFALLDAAREPQILDLLAQSREEHRSLY